VRVEDLYLQPIAILEGIGATHADAVSKGLSVSTVRDLALWPPYLAAKAFVAAAMISAGRAGVVRDPETPFDLLPASGEFATERVFYSTLLFDGPDESDDPRTQLEDGPVDLSPMFSSEFGFNKPAIGALLTLSQSWYAQGVALGQLLHSVALAPGESTRIAMLDWSRRTTGVQTEDVTETEALSNVTEHSRALSEVTRAVAQEAQQGFSESETGSDSSQGGTGVGFSLGPITVGQTSSDAVARGRAMRFSSSQGRREISADTAQQVLDRTQQHANAARNRRATVVREVSQKEQESVSTRVVTNYNHMHALSVQYYEMIQVYRVTVQLARAEQCLFVPIKMLDFNDARIVRQFRKTLAAAAIDSSAGSSLNSNLDTVTVATTVADRLFLSNAFGVPAEVKPDGKTIVFPDEARLFLFKIYADQPPLAIAITLRDGTLAELEKIPPPSSTTTSEYRVVNRVALREIASITLTRPDAAGNSNYLCECHAQFNGVGFGWSATFPLVANTPTTVLTVTGGGVWQDVIDHLQSARLHYSQAIIRALDPATVVLLLTPYTFRGDPVISMIDPQPVTVAGNYVVFKTAIRGDADAEMQAQRDWASWLDRHGVRFGVLKEDLVPLPSGGVFAEAVLGRFNSAEKLDMTRFWNWQDSPIPIQAPEIAPVQLGSRAQPEDLRPGSFSQPLVNIVTPTPLPDPSGLGATLQAISNGNMFRDMSGLAGTIAAAQSALQASSDAATAAGIQAGGNLATAAKKEVEMFKAALAFAATMMGRGSPDTAPSTISNEGAKINHGRSLDARTVPASGGGATPMISGASGSLGGATGGGGVGAGGGGAAGGRSGAPMESDAFYRSLYGREGQSTSLTARDLLNVGGSGRFPDDTYARPAVTPNQLVGLVGEQVLANALESHGLVVFRDWTKHVAGNGFDLIAYLPGDPGMVWLLDNKAQLRGIDAASSLSGPQFDRNLMAAKHFLANRTPDPRGANALRALESGAYKKVVANAWAADSVTFTRKLFDIAGINVYDMRLQKLYGSHSAWQSDFTARPRTVRRIGQRGAISVQEMVLVLAMAGEVLWAMRSGKDLGTALGETAANTALGAVLSLLPGGVAAGFALGLESDETETQRQLRKRRELIDQIAGSIPGFLGLPEAEQTLIKIEIGRLVDDPLRVEIPDVQTLRPWSLPPMHFPGGVDI
jgi:hypothetical protein